MNTKYSKNVETVLSLLKDEVRSDVKGALSKMTDDYSMTWVYRKKDGTLFPRTENDLIPSLKNLFPSFTKILVATSEKILTISRYSSYFFLCLTQNYEEL